jgi:hypothetical protein
VEERVDVRDILGIVVFWLFWVSRIVESGCVYVAQSLIHYPRHSSSSDQMGALPVLGYVGEPRISTYVMWRPLGTVSPRSSAARMITYTIFLVFKDDELGKKTCVLVLSSLTAA